MGLDLFNGPDHGFEDARNRLNQTQKSYDNIVDPNYREYVPEVYTNASSNYQLTGEDPLMKAAQMSALQKMAGLSQTGLSDVDQAGYEKARSLGAEQARQGNAAAMQSAQARGVGGSGLEFAMREMANQGGAQNAQASGLQQSADSARQRALYSQAYGQQIAGARDQDFRANAANTGIINQFNSMNTQNQNKTNNANVDQKNNAFMYNEGLKDKNFSNQMARANQRAGIQAQVGQVSAAEEAARRQRNGAIIGTVGGIAGGMMGGPAGAQAGYAAGSSLA